MLRIAELCRLYVNLSMVAPKPTPDPVIWVLHDGKPGMISQAVGLAEAVGFPFIEKPLTVRHPWGWLPPQMWPSPLRAVRSRQSGLAPPWPDLVIGCGRNTAAPALAIRRAARGQTIAAQVQDPRIGRAEFDLLIVPAHDRLRGPRVVVTMGAIHRVTPDRLASELARFPELQGLPRPVLAALIGGANRSYRFDLAKMADIADMLAAVLRERGGSAVVTPSRRTGSTGVALLRERLAGLPAAIWDGTGANPYFAYLAIADAVLVTADSVSMISEAAATGKPVHVIPLPGGDAKFSRFHESFEKAGITRQFTSAVESWNYAPPDDNARAGRVVRELLMSHLARPLAV